MSTSFDQDPYALVSEGARCRGWGVVHGSGGGRSRELQVRESFSLKKPRPQAVLYVVTVVGYVI